MDKGGTSRDVKGWLITGAIALMFVGLLFSRFLLSAGSLLFFLFACIPTGRSAPMPPAAQRRYYFLLPVLFLVPLISGIWSANFIEWWARTQVKLPLLIFPIAFSFSGNFSSVQKKWISVFFSAVILCGSGWSLLKYLGNVTELNNSYHYAGVIPTPMDDDHVRFSWAVLIAILLLVKLFLDNQVKRGAERVLLLLLIVWLVVYLHILAAKTGLAGLYIAAAVLLVQQLGKTGKRKWLPAGILLLVLLPLIAYWLLPSFHNRIHYLLYDFEQYRQLHFPGGLPDGARVLSWIAIYGALYSNGTALITRIHPCTTGFFPVTSSCCMPAPVAYRGCFYLPQRFFTRC